MDECTNTDVTHVVNTTFHLINVYDTAYFKNTKNHVFKIIVLKNIYNCY